MRDPGESPGGRRSAFENGAREDARKLLALHDELAAGRGGVVVLAGPRGVGKGALLTSLRGDLAARGRLVLYGRAEKTATRPFAAFHDPAAQALAHLETRGHAEAFLDEHAHALGVLLPRLSSPETSSRARDRTGYFEAMRALLIDLGRRAPLTMLISDVHYADDDTRDLVKFLAAHLFDPDGIGASAPEGFSGVLCLAVRTDDDDGAALCRDLCDGRSFIRYEVAGLTRDDVLRYLEDHPAVDRLLEASKGRPEDIDELLDALPPDTDSLLLQRIADLDEPARRAFTALAIIGRPAPPDLVATVLELPVKDVVSALGHLVEARLVARRLQTGQLLFTFARPHHLEVVLSHTDPDEKQALHTRVGDALEAWDLGDEDLDQRLAYHFLSGVEPGRGAAYALRACSKLLVTFAYGAAVDLARRALAVAPDDDVRLSLLRHLVEGLKLKGQIVDALDAALELKDLATGEERVKALRQLGELTSQKGEHRQAMAYLEEALTGIDALPTDDDDTLPERSLILAAMGDVTYAMGDFGLAGQHAHAALQGREEAPPAFRVRVDNLRGKIAYSHEAFEEAERLFLRNLELAQANQLESEATLARVNAGLSRYRRGGLVEARDILDRALLSARAEGDIYNEAHALLNLAVIDQRLSDLGRSLKHFTAALSLFSRLGNRSEVRRTTWNLANVFAAIGNSAKARVYLDQSRRLAEAEDSDRGRAFVYFTEGDLAFDEGRGAAALTAYEQARAIFDRLGERSRVAEMTVKAAWAALRLGDVEAARTRLDQLGEPSPGTLLAARRDALLGAIQSLGDDDEDVIRGVALLSDAIDELERHQAEEDAWRGLLLLAERYEGRGDEASASSARDRARDVVTDCADRLPTEHRRVFLDHPVRSALVDAVPGGAPEEPDVIEEMRYAVPPHDPEPLPPPEIDGPTERTSDWDQRFPELVGRSPTLLRVFERLDRISRSQQPTVLIRGESGTGKELVAAAVHRLSDRRGGPFVRVNCAALVETLLLSELFGHEKGSFTGAFARKIGRFELAQGGTIFLDEIGDISQKTQVSLLRVLQERSFERVGGTKTIATDAVVICATHRDLESMVQEGSFREDLYYRLRGVVVEVPPLRDRPEDIQVLVRRFLAEAQREIGRAPSRLSTEAEELLTSYGWPGNIRELQNVVRSVGLFCEGDVVELRHLREFPELFQRGRPVERPRHKSAPAAPHSRPTNARPAAETPAPAPPEPAPPSTPTNDVLRRVGEHATGDGIALGDLKRKLEFEAIANAMRQTNGNITRAAAMLKMKRPRLSQIVNGDPQLKAIKEESRQRVGSGGSNRRGPT